MRVSFGARVRLNVPENARLHGAAAVVREALDWGCHLDCPAAATGRFRALWSELLVPSAPPPGGYTGDLCDACGSSRMTRAGACLACLDCGTSGGCG